jgi:hypothetical protein
VSGGRRRCDSAHGGAAVTAGMDSPIQREVARPPYLRQTPPSSPAASARAPRRQPAGIGVSLTAQRGGRRQDGLFDS